MMKRTLALAGSLFILLTLSLLAVPVAGQQSRAAWSQPQLLGPGWWNSLTMDREGRLHVAWYGKIESDEDLGSPDVMSYAAREPDGTWTEHNDVIYTGNGGYTVRNALAVTSNGMLHAVYRAGAVHLFASAPARAASDASLWDKPVSINDSGYYVDMIADRHDVLHVVYSGGIGVLSRGGQIVHAELSPCALCNDMYYRRSTDGGLTWSTPLPIGFEADSGSDRIEIFEGNSGRLYISWDEGHDWYQGSGTAKDVRIVYSDDGGLSWSDPIILDGGGYVDRRPIQIAAAELLDGSLMAVWRYSTDLDRGIYYQMSTDSGITWTKPQAIPGLIARSINDTPLDDYKLLVDRLGTVSLFAAGQINASRQMNASIYQIRYRDGIWSAPQRIFYSREQRPEWPKAVLGPQNDIHLVFFTRAIREDAINVADAVRDLQVYYAYYPGNLPAQITAFNPTSTPPPTPTLVQIFEPTQTPFRLQSPMEETITPATSDTYAAQVLLSGMVAAGLLCAGVLVISRYVRRR